MTSLDDIEKLLISADSLKDGPAKIAVLEEAVLAADAYGDIDWQFHTRHTLVEACFTGGDPERLLVALSWSLAKCDKLGGCYDEDRLLWGCKFALSYITAFPQISLAQIAELREYAIERFRKYGASLRVVYLHCMGIEIVNGNTEQAENYHRLWRTFPRDGFSEPPDWEQFFEAWYHFFHEDKDRALELGIPMLEGKNCTPMVLLWVAHLLLPELVKRGDRDRAISAHLRTIRQTTENPKYLAQVASHLTFLTLTGNFARAASVLSRQLADALHLRVPSAQFSFYLSAWMSAKYMETNSSNEVKLILPEEFPLQQPDGCYRWSELSDWFEAQTHDLEAQFNARNENTYFSKLITKQMDYVAHAKEWPIRTSAGDG